jgi:hypothetical protein
MKMGLYERRKMRDNILDDLYRKAEEKLQERRVEIARKSREYYIEPLMSTMSALPIEMVTHDREYIIRVKYTAPTSTNTDTIYDHSIEDSLDINENWVYRSDDPIINPKNPKQGGANYYSNVPENTIDERLHGEVNLLCQDILKLKAKRDAMNSYLVETTTKYTGSLQLRKAWKDSPHLLKYLPEEPMKTPRTRMVGNKKVATEDPPIPEGLKEQLTENLLEGA